MELKHSAAIPVYVFLILLIVPYGIETVADFVYIFGFIVLLIVPYGIETAIYRPL